MRDYDPTTGRYIQADPLGLVDGASVFGYALQNPGRYVDPRGEQSSTFGGTLGPLGIAGSVAPGSPLGDALGQSLVSSMSSMLSAGSSPKPISEIGQGQCPDPCAQQRQRVRDAKAQHVKINGSASCRLSDHSTVLVTKFTRWREECSARRERDRICPSLTAWGPQKPNAAGEYGEQKNACRHAAICAALIPIKMVGSGI